MRMAPGACAGLSRPRWAGPLAGHESWPGGNGGRTTRGRSCNVASGFSRKVRVMWLPALAGRQALISQSQHLRALEVGVRRESACTCAAAVLDGPPNGPENPGMKVSTIIGVMLATGL